MHQQIRLMFQHPVQASIQTILFRRREVPAQEHVHGAVIEPMPVQAELAAGLDQPVHHQQFQHLRPRHVLSPRRQSSPPRTGLIAIAATTRIPTSSSRRVGPAPVSSGGVLRARCRARRQGWAGLRGTDSAACSAAPARRKPPASAPGGLLAVVDFPQVQHLFLRHFSRAEPPALDHRVVAMFFAIFEPLIGAQKQVPCRMPESLAAA